ncbi:isoleucine--tRNA ligase [Candidatus Trichorickettsia mobilis]|uniref:isoleucine--tRNA ligase n=1 Tax=Candidatus Trichorickettsia mobilis TaxID=1346319 RepID=UPI002930AD97|nr:isoleucine--tRNA ligase [Candidatus Trichorickettsia mobilis]
MTEKIYQDVASNVNFPELERKILAYWAQNNIFQKSIDNRAGSDEFIFYDGPPFANGLPHYGHLLTGFIKDLYARYQTSKGKKCERIFGWDCHGLPAEMAAEKELGITGRLAITEFGIDKFNDHCRKSVMKYTNEWQEYVNRQARWVDFENSYRTMDFNFMESVLWAFKELYKKGLVYEAMRVMPYSWACETPLSNFETRLDNAYREKLDKAVTVSFILKEKPRNLQSNYNYQEYRILAWTTMPWTFPPNLALAVGADIEYVLVPKDKICYILAKSALAKYAKELAINDEQDFEVITGRDLEGLSYQPLFEYFSDHPNSFRILIGNFVTDTDGTGVVSIAPAFGEDDHNLCAQHNIELVCPVDNAGIFTSEVADFVGMQVFDANDAIIIKLKNQGNWIKTEQYIHNYPHCWRTDTPLIYKAVPSWYVKVTSFKERMVELNQQINWIPFSVKDGLFGKWLENARDWSISRNRFWGTPIPIWKSDDPNYPRIDVYGSIAELEHDFGVKIQDLHRPFIDSLTRANPDDPTGKSVMRRVEDVFDCWFESGSMPYSQVHYPFENKEWFETHFPADFIVEYSAQTRGWFYTLMVLSTALFDRPPFLNCICHGVILDSSGQKLSKRLNNYADPLELFDKYGSDALRVTMLSSAVVKGQELLIDKDGKMVYEVLRLFIKPIWNAYHFFILYANADRIKAELTFNSSDLLDRYIFTKLKIAVNSIEQGLDNFDTQSAYAAIADFFEVLNNWYIRRSRYRFWKSERDQDKIDAYNTLYTCLEVMCRAISSLLPLITEEIYLGLTGGVERGESVHLTDFPQLDQLITDENLMMQMDKVQDICSSALFIRNLENIRTRQPLKSLTIITDGAGSLTEFDELIKDEINVKTIIHRQDLDQYATKKLSINFPMLGKRLPHKMKDIIAASKSNIWVIKDKQLEVAGELLNPEEFAIILVPKAAFGAKALADNSGLVILDLEISAELQAEGTARDLIRIIQQARKEAGFEISDRVYLEIVSIPLQLQELVGELEVSERKQDIVREHEQTRSLTPQILKFKRYKAHLDAMLQIHGEFINTQTLSEFAVDLSADYSSSAELHDQLLTIKLKKII